MVINYTEIKSAITPINRDHVQTFLSEIEKAGGVDFDKPVLLAYSGLEDSMLQKYIEDSRALWEDHVSELSQTCIGSVIGTHLGPGVVIVAFFSKK